MKNWYLVLLFLWLSSALVAQHDKNWVFGYENYTTPHNVVCGMVLDMSQDTPSTGILSIYPEAIGNYQTAVISDTAGMLMFYTNGCRIRNRYHEVVLGGDKIGKDDIFFNRTCESDNFLRNKVALQGVLFLPRPDNPDNYILFHTRQDSLVPTDNLLLHPQSLLMTELDAKGNQGKGSVIELDLLLVQDTLLDLISAVRHGNGRDWWISIPKYNSDIILLFLLTPEKVLGPYRMKTPLIWESEPNRLPLFGGKFSPDGSLYVRSESINGNIHLYYFNRCTGEFCCPKTLTFPKGIATGVEFSPNGRFLYVANSEELYQFDLFAEDVQGSRFLLGEYDGFWCPGRCSFFQMQLAPNGKIYMGTFSTSVALHTIHQPNDPKESADFGLYDVLLPCYKGKTIPQLPNYRLLDFHLSPCDTLGINDPSRDPDTALFPKFTAYPNPSRDEVTLALPACKVNIKYLENGLAHDHILRIYAADGRIMYMRTGLRSAEKITIDIRTWAAGVYFASLYRPGLPVETIRLMVTRW